MNSMLGRVTTAASNILHARPGCRRLSRVASLSLVLVLVWSIFPWPAQPPALAAPATAITGLHVSGNQILNAAGQPVRLRGVNRTSGEYACIQNWGIFEGPVTDQAIQVFGGMGLMEELPLEMMWRDARVERIWEGTSEIQRHIISREMLRAKEQ